MREQLEKKNFVSLEIEIHPRFKIYRKLTIDYLKISTKNKVNSPNSPNNYSFFVFLWV